MMPEGIYLWVPDLVVSALVEAGNMAARIIPLSALQALVVAAVFVAAVIVPEDCRATIHYCYRAWRLAAGF